VIRGGNLKRPGNPLHKKNKPQWEIDQSPGKDTKWAGIWGKGTERGAWLKKEVFSLESREKEEGKKR